VSADLILETRGLEKRFGGVRAIAAVDFSLERGELRCLIGPNGAGKSTFFKLLTGQIEPSAGAVLFEGVDVTAAAPHRIGRLGIGIKNQVQDVFNGLSVYENLYLAASSSHGRRIAEARARELAARLGLEALLAAPVATLAHGQRQWVEIAMVVAREPKLILLDEPSAGMTSEETNQTALLIREVNRTATIVVVEHDMQFIRQIARKVTVFHQGRILVEDTFERVVADPMVRAVYLGRRTVA
jgi:branched-chain amino acid transport system ATP-binding protein/urea transport system ATP-binding protein